MVQDAYIFPLSFAQQRLWFLDQLAPGNSFYNADLAFPLDGPVNLHALKRSVQEIVARHETLRTTFAVVGDEPMQMIAPALSVAMPVIDLRALAPAARRAEAQRLATEEALRPFDLARGPLLRATVLQLGETENLVLLTLHHIVCDGWSLGILFKELSTLYAAFCQGAPSPLPELPIQYADFAVWQRESLQGEALAAQVTYWKQRLGGLPVLRLPTDRPRPSVQTFQGAHQNFRVSADDLAKLHALSRSEGVTFFMTLLAAFQLLLHRYSGQDDIVVGTYVANRTRAELEALIGFFVNTLVLRTDLSGDPPFRAALHRVRDVALGAYAHQDLPFEKLVAELHPARDLSRNPLCQVTFQLVNVPGLAMAAESTERAVHVEPGSAIFDLALSFWEDGEGLSGQVEYSTDLFDAETVARLLEHYHTLLQGIVANPAERLSRLPLLSAPERRQLVSEWNDTAADLAVDACIHEMFEAQASRTPDAVAVTHRGSSLTYEALNRRANRLAHTLRARGVGRETLVGVCVERSLDMVVALLAILKAGGAYLPLDPGYPKDRLAFMVSHARAPVLLAHGHLLEALPLVPDVICIDADRSSADQSDNPVSGVGPDHLAYAMYTSGSTGRPKGVLGTHRAMLNRFHWMWQAYAFRAGEVCCQKTALSFVDSIWELFGPLLAGVPTHILDDAVARDPRLLIDALRAHKVSRIVLVPSLLRAMLDTDVDLAAQLPDLRLWVASGEALPRELVERFHEHVPDRVLLNLYGSSEVAADATWHDSRSDAADATVAIGRPLANVQAYVLDGRQQLVPVGVPGELYIGGAGLARGYLHRPDLTAERFVPNGFGNGRGARLYRTGDLARYRADGTLEFLGRVDHQIKVRGFRVELEEVEAALRQHAAVAQAVVAPRERESSDTQLVAYVVEDRDAGGSNGAGDAGARADDQVPRWQLVWDEAYLQPRGDPDPQFDIVGWTSSYTGLPIPPDEMRDWVDRTADRIRALQPRRILEIGCGTGLLLFRLAPHCTEYIGTDFSAVVLQHLEHHLARAGARDSHVTLRQQAADDFSGIDPQSVDAIVLNSVVQYFPDVDYLLRVLDGAVRALAPRGFIFIGDVRSLPLLEAFHAWVEIQRAPSSLALDQLRRRVQKRTMLEQELALDPAFFAALRDRFPNIGRATVTLKRGRHHNELTCFRYDVTLRTGSNGRAAAIPPSIDWQERGLTPQALAELLSEPDRDALVVSRVPNERLRGVVVGLASLWGDDASVTTAGDVRARSRALDAMGVEPEALWGLGDRMGYAVDVRWSAAGLDCCDAVFVRRAGVPATDGILDGGDASRVRPWRTYANNPAEGAFAQRLVPRLREFLQERLPDFMVPAAFVLLDRLPLTPSGKVDRQALPAPDGTRPDLDQAYVAPRTDAERLLAGLWSELLGIDQPGIHDNFFTELGGHSLLATQVVSRLRLALQVEIPLRQFFETPTIAGLAAALEAACPGAPGTSGRAGTAVAGAHDLDLEEGVI